VPLERLASQFSSKTLKALLFVCVLAALCLVQTTAAQSGRRAVKKVSPVPAEPAASAQAEKPTPRITSVIVCGHDITEGQKEYLSNNVSHVVDTITATLNDRPKLLMGVVNGGKLKREEAVERAKHEQNAYVLWFGYSMKLVNLYYNSVEHMDYVVYKPQTAEVVAEGRVYPDEQKTHADPGGIMRLPTNRRRSRIPNTSRQLEDGAREIANRVKNKF
jgi:hypothetical protein